MEHTMDSSTFTGLRESLPSAPNPKSDLDKIIELLKNRPAKYKELIDRNHIPPQKFVDEITNPVLPKLVEETEDKYNTPLIEIGRVIVPERSKSYEEPKNGETEPYSKRDVAIVQLEDMGEKVVDLRNNILSYLLQSKEQRTPVQYRRLEEACVKYAIQLDRVNIIGREKPRESRRMMLIFLDKLSTCLVHSN